MQISNSFNINKLDSYINERQGSNLIFVAKTLFPKSPLHNGLHYVSLAINRMCVPLFLYAANCDKTLVLVNLAYQAVNIIVEEVHARHKNKNFSLYPESVQSALNAYYQRSVVKMGLAWSIFPPHLNPFKIVNHAEYVNVLLATPEVVELLGEKGCRLMGQLARLPDEVKVRVVSCISDNLALLNLIAEPDPFELRQLFLNSGICSPYFLPHLEKIYDSGLSDWLDKALNDPASDAAWELLDQLDEEKMQALISLKNLFVDEVTLSRASREFFDKVKQRVRQNGVFEYLMMGESEIKALCKEVGAAVTAEVDAERLQASKERYRKEYFPEMINPLEARTIWSGFVESYLFPDELDPLLDSVRSHYTTLKSPPKSDKLQQIIRDFQEAGGEGAANQNRFALLTLLERYTPFEVRKILGYKVAEGELKELKSLFFALPLERQMEVGFKISGIADGEGDEKIESLMDRIAAFM